MYLDIIFILILINNDIVKIGYVRFSLKTSNTSATITEVDISKYNAKELINCNVLIYTATAADAIKYRPQCIISRVSKTAIFVTSWGIASGSFVADCMINYK